LRALVYAGVFALVTLPVLAQSNLPFVASATTTLPANNITLTASGSNFETFVDDIIAAEGQFQQLSGKPFAGSSTFLGVQNAIVFQVNATGTVVSFGLAPINFSKTFTGTSSSDVSSQITDFFKKNGAQTISDFLAAIAKQSTIAVTDGNPNAATAIAANDSFMTLGFTPAEQTADTLASSNDSGPGAMGAGTAEKPRFSGLAIGFNAGTFTSGAFSGTSYDLSSSGFNIRLTDRVRIVTPLYLNYVKVSGAQIGGFGGSLAVPVTIRVIDKDSPWAWRLTPSFGLGGRVSVDLAGGTALWQAGLTSAIDYKVGPKLMLGVINQLTEDKSIAVKDGDFNFDPHVDQQILKNGVRFVTPIKPRLIGDFFIVDSRFLKDAAVKSFETFGASIAMHVTEKFNLRLGANYDIGTQFRSYSAGLSSAWQW